MEEKEEEPPLFTLFGDDDALMRDMGKRMREEYTDEDSALERVWKEEKGFKEGSTVFYGRHSCGKEGLMDREQLFI